VPIAETVDATKVRMSPADALKLLTGMTKLLAARGKKVEVFDLKKDRPDDEALLARLIGPSGNLRAPTFRVGKTLVVGFNEDAYRKVLGV
jgi:arsenate reductase-like glutaredoxin family protein